MCVVEVLEASVTCVVTTCGRRWKLQDYFTGATLNNDFVDGVGSEIYMYISYTEIRAIVGELAVAVTHLVVVLRSRSCKPISISYCTLLLAFKALLWPGVYCACDD